MTTPTYPAQLKVTLAPADDTDPPTNPVWTRDNITAVHPPVIIIKDLPTPHDYGAVGDGVSDDTNAYQLWLNAIAGNAGYGAAGTFLISTNLAIHSGTTIYGSGRGTHILKKAAGFPASLMMMSNANYPTVAGVYTDSDIQLFGMMFDGSNLTTNQPLLHYRGVIGAVIRDCNFFDSRYMATAFAGCGNLTIDNNRFNNWGRTEDAYEFPAGSQLREGGPAIWAQPDANGNCVDVSITNNWFTNGLWGGISTGAERITIANNHFLNLKEYGIFGGPIKCTISGNQFEQIGLVDVSNHGIEAGGTDVIVIGNTFTDIGGDAIHCTDGIRWDIADNVVLRPQRDAQAPYLGNGISVLSFGYATISTLNIHNNTVHDPTGRTGFGIGFALLGDGTPITDMQCKGNVLPGPWAVSAIGFFPDVPTVIGARCMIRDNCGASDQDWSRSAVQFTIPVGSTGALRIGGVGFQPSSIDFQAVVPRVAGIAAASVGQVSWLTGWDIATQAINSPRTNMQSSAIAVSTDGTDSFSDSTPGTRCINILAADGTTLCAASLTAIEADGFIITIEGTTLTHDVFVTAMCYC
jgi:hypothetical protein